MIKASKPKPTWKELLSREKPLLLPGAHDALTSRLIERAGFSAYVIGGYALVGARYAIPDIGLAAYGEISAGIRDIIAATDLPVMVDTDTGYGDVKNVTHTIRGYEAMGVSSIFMEDQVSPKRCGHMRGKDVISVREMCKKIEAAVKAMPDEPLLRVWIKTSSSHMAVIDAPPPTAEVVVIAPDLARTVPVTPPQRMVKVRVGVAVVPYAPKARSRSTRPS